MASSEITWNLEEKTLDQVSLLQQLPCVLKVSYSSLKAWKHYQFSRSEVFLLEAVATPTYLRVKVVDYDDPVEAESEFGTALVQERLKLLNTKHFLPSGYQGDVLKHYKARYHYVWEVLQEMPAWVEVLKPFEVPGLGAVSRTEVLSGTVLKVNEVKGDKGQRVLCCYVRETGQPLELKESWQISCRSLTTGQLVKLKDILATKALPQKVTFGRVEPSLLLAPDQEGINRLAAVLSGPVEILSCHSFVMYVCRTRDVTSNNTIVNNTVLVSLAMAHKQHIFLPLRTGDLQTRFFPALSDSLLPDQLYLVCPETVEKETIFLRTGLQPDKLIQIRPAPTLPRRPSDRQLDVEVPIRAAQEKQSSVKDYLKAAKRKCEFGFDKVHAELRGLKLGLRTRKVPEVTDDKPAIPHQHRRQSGPEITAGDQACTVPTTHAPGIPTTTRHQKSQEIRLLTNSGPPSPHDKRTAGVEDEIDDYLEPISKRNQESTNMNREKEPLVDVDRTFGETHMSKQAQTFFGYTVNQLIICCRQCGLNKLANICRDECLDGNFFSFASKEMLNDKPFNLTHIELVKLEQMIDGWRPKL